MKSENGNTSTVWMPAIAIIATLIIGFGSIGTLVMTTMIAWQNSTTAIMDARFSAIEAKLDAVIEKYDRRFEEMDKKLDEAKTDLNQTSQNLTTHLENHN